MDTFTSFTILEQLKLAIQRDFDVLQQNQSKVVSEKNRLLERNGHLDDENAQLKLEHKSLKQRITELQNDLTMKNEQVESCKRKLEKLRKKELWWNEYLEATELRIGLLAKHGSFPDNIREWLDKDVTDVITLCKNGTISSNTKDTERHSMKLSTSKSNKRIRYSNMSPPIQNVGVVCEHSGLVQEHSEVTQEHSGLVREHSGLVREHSRVLREHSRVLREHSSAIVSTTDADQGLHSRKADIITHKKEKENVQLKSSKLDISNSESKEDRKNKRSNSGQVLKAKKNQPVIDVDVNETVKGNLTEEKTVNFDIGPPSLASTPVFSTDNQHFFTAETQFDETIGLENPKSLGLPDNSEIQTGNDLSGIPCLSPTVQCKVRSVSSGLTAPASDESVSVIPQQGSDKDQNEFKEIGHCRCDNTKDTIMSTKQFRHLQDSKYGEADVNYKVVENSSSEYDEYGTTLKYSSRNMHTTSVGQPDNCMSSRLVSEPGNRREAPGSSRAADGPRQSRLRQSKLKQHIQQESRVGASRTTNGPRRSTPKQSTLRQHVEQESGTGVSPCKRKRSSSSGSDVECNPVKQLQEEAIYVVESPKEEKSLFKVPAAPLQLLSLSSSARGPNQVTHDYTILEMETSMDLFGYPGASNEENSNNGRQNENESEDIDETGDEGESVLPVDKDKERGKTEFDQPLPSNSETTPPAQDVLDDTLLTVIEAIENLTLALCKRQTWKEQDFDEEGKYQEYLRQRKEPEAPYKYQEVVRKKEDRAKLNGYSCRDCERYFNSLSLTDKEKKMRMKQCSRHRAKFSPPPNTPEGFWNLSFPETQEYMEKGYMRSEAAGPPPRRTNKPRRARRKLQQ